MTRIEVGSHVGPTRLTQTEECLHVEHTVPRMHLERELHVVLSGESAVLLPEGDYLLRPLPLEQLREVRWPPRRYPIRILATVGSARAAREKADLLDAEHLCGEYRLTDDVLRTLCVGRIG